MYRADILVLETSEFYHPDREFELQANSKPVWRDRAVQAWAPLAVRLLVLAALRLLRFFAAFRASALRRLISVAEYMVPRQAGAPQ